MAGGSGAKQGWQRIARRIRVPLGFVTAAVFLVFARPQPRWVLLSLVAVLPGLWLRGYAAGYVRKNAELTRSGPYAYTRNPLYLGSMLIAFGFAVAAGRVALGVLLVALFLLIYWPVIRAEETYLRATFPEYEAYAARVPRLLPRWSAAAAGEAQQHAGCFSAQRYRHHHEYNSLIGAAALYAALGVRAWIAHRPVFF